jgi:hypothetical protein
VLNITVNILPVTFPIQEYEESKYLDDRFSWVSILQTTISMSA